MRTFWIAVLLVSVPVAVVAVTAKAVLYVPFDVGGVGPRSGYTASATERGLCWTDSLASQRRDAYRCSVGNEIHDPCFANNPGSEVACPVKGPFSKTVVVIELDKRLPTHSTSLGPSPWGVRLASGAVCQFTTGATGVVAGMRLNFVCTTGGWVLGEVDRGSQPWHVFYTPSFRSGNYSQVDVSEVVL